MEIIPAQIKFLVGNDEEELEKKIAIIIGSFMTNFHQPYSEIIKIPLPLAFKIMEEWAKQNKKMEQEIKHGRKH